MIKYLRMSQSFDVQIMQEELGQFSTKDWQLHYNTAHYTGDWSILPLRSLGGHANNLLAVHASAAEKTNVYKDTILLESCAYIKSILESFACNKMAVRLMKLHAGAVIKAHSDHDLSFEEGEIRLHIPITTNPGVEFFVEDERITMREGECWYLNLSLQHKVNNRGIADRVHLVIDCEVNDWIREQFNQPGLLQKHIEVAKEATYTPEEKQQIIDQLKLLNTPVSLKLANKLENE